MNHQLRTNPHSDIPEPVDQPQEAIPEILATLTLEEARDYLLDTAIERAPVADDEQVYGIVSLADLDHAIARGADPEQETSTLFADPFFADPFWDAAAPVETQNEPAPPESIPSRGRQAPLSTPRSDRRNGTLRTTIEEIIGNRPSPRSRRSSAVQRAGL